MSQPVEGSALKNVFGSHVSLAELNGDVSRAQSRAPSRPATPRKQSAATTKRARSRTITQQKRPAARRSLKSKALGALVLYAAGVIMSAGASHFIVLGRFGKEMAALEAKIHPLFMQLAGVLAVAVGALFVAMDSDVPLARSKDWNGLVRGAGAVLGLCYATTKLNSTYVFWGLSNPILWYVIDASPVGFTLSAALSVIGAALSSLVYTCSWHDLLLISATVFSAAILWGNLGRRLL